MVSFPSVCFILLLLLCSFPALRLCTVKDLLLGTRAVGFSARLGLGGSRSSCQEQESSRAVPWVPAQAGVCGGRWLKTATHRTAAQKTLWTRIPQGCLVWERGKDVSRAVLLLGTAPEPGQGPPGRAWAVLPVKLQGLVPSPPCQPAWGRTGEGQRSFTVCSFSLMCALLPVAHAKAQMGTGENRCKGSREELGAVCPGCVWDLPGLRWHL